MKLALLVNNIKKVIALPQKVLKDLIIDIQIISLPLERERG